MVCGLDGDTVAVGLAPREHGLHTAGVEIFRLDQGDTGTAQAQDSINITTYGGAFAAAVNEAYARPFTEATGIQANMVHALPSRTLGPLIRLSETHALPGGTRSFHFGPADGPYLLVLTHADTVWPHGTLERMPWREDGERLYGPGTYDMKGGIVGLFHALRSLQGAWPRGGVRVLLSPDEVKITWKLRRALAGLDPQQALEVVLGKLKETQSNVEFLVQMQKSIPAPARDSHGGGHSHGHENNIR